MIRFVKLDSESDNENLIACIYVDNPDKWIKMLDYMRTQSIPVSVKSKNLEEDYYIASDDYFDSIVLSIDSVNIPVEERSCNCIKVFVE